MIKKIVDRPRSCPFAEKDYDGFMDGCEISGTKCYNDYVFPSDCPLNKEDILVTKKDK